VPDFSIDLSTMLSELPFVARFEEAARLGFEAVELSHPSPISSHELSRKLRDCGLSLIALDLLSRDEEEGICIACDPHRTAEFRDDLGRAIAYAAGAGCRFLSCVVAPLPQEVVDPAAHRALLDNLRFAARKAHGSGIRIGLEPRATSGRHRHHTLEAVSLLDAAGMRNLAVLYDIPRAHAAGESVESVMRHCLPRIGHLRNSEGRGAGRAVAGRIDYERLFEFIDGIGHHGWVGLGSRESLDAGLAWMARHGNPRAPCRWGIPLHAFRGADTID
jgi:hydroxypyruvate isomerase